MSLLVSTGIALPDTCDREMRSTPAGDLVWPSFGSLAHGMDKNSKLRNLLLPTSLSYAKLIGFVGTHHAYWSTHIGAFEQQACAAGQRTTIAGSLVRTAQETMPMALNLVLIRIMSCLVVELSSAVKDTSTYKVRCASMQCRHFVRPKLIYCKATLPNRVYSHSLPNTYKMAKNNRQKNNNHNKKPSAKPAGQDANRQHPNRQHSANPTNNSFNYQPTNGQNLTSRPPQCQICGKPHKGTFLPFCIDHSSMRSFTNHTVGECRYKNAAGQSRPTNNCSYCGKKGHDESVCFKKNPSKRQNNAASTLFTKKSLTVRREGRWETPFDCQRERDQSAVSFPLTLVGTMALTSQEYGLTSNSWFEDSDHDAIMCLHDCRSGGNFCCRRFAVKCANQLKQSIRQPNPGVTNTEHATLVISQRDEEALWQTMISYGVPNNGFGESTLMDIDEVL